jgi:hypothetical protein
MNISSILLILRIPMWGAQFSSYRFNGLMAALAVSVTLGIVRT